MLLRYLPGAPQVVPANLGYLPGGDRNIATHAQSSRLALEAALEALAPGGRLAAVVYVGHAEGVREREMVDALVGGLCARLFHVLRLEVPNRREAPYLLVVEKRNRGGGG